MRLSTRSAFRRPPRTAMHHMRRSHRTQGIVAVAAALTIATVAAGSLFLPASAADGDSAFTVKARDTAGHTASAGLTAELTDPGSGGTGGAGGAGSTPAPSTAAEFTLRDVSTNYFTLKSNSEGTEQPSIRIPPFDLDGSSLSSARDWRVVIPKNAEPFNMNASYKDGRPEWAEITETSNSFVISNKDSTMRLGGSTKSLLIPKLEFNYDAPTYGVLQTTNTVTRSPASGNDQLLTVRVSTADSKAFSLGKWMTTVNISSLRSELGNTNGELSLNSTDPGYSLTKVSDSLYTLSYSGTTQNNYIKGVDAVNRQLEDAAATGYFDATYVLKLAPGTSTNQVSNADGTVTLELTQNSRTVSARYVKLPPAATPWTIDLDLSKLVAIDRTKTPVVYNNQFTLAKKSGDIYTLSYNGKGSPTVGGSGSAGQVDIQLPW